MGMRIIPIKVGNEMWAKSYFVDGGAYEPAVEIPHMMFFIEGAEKIFWSTPVDEIRTLKAGGFTARPILVPQRKIQLLH